MACLLSSHIKNKRDYFAYLMQFYWRRWSRVHCIVGSSISQCRLGHMSLVVTCFQVIITAVLRPSRTRSRTRSGWRVCRTRDEPIRSGTRTQTWTNQVSLAAALRTTFPWSRGPCSAVCPAVFRGGVRRVSGLQRGSEGEDAAQRDDPDAPALRRAVRALAQPGLQRRPLQQDGASTHDIIKTVSERNITHF